jgi:hypothetical protein
MSTLTTSLSRPQPGEYNPYYERYISLVGSDDIVGLLERQAPQTIALFQSARAKSDFRYAPEKWSVKEMLGHVNDTERIMAYRALRVLRGDQTPLAGFEQDDYIRDGNFAQRTLEDLLPKPEPAAGWPATPPSAPAPWPISSLDMNCIIAGCWKKNISAKEFSVPGSQFSVVESKPHTENRELRTEN